MIHVLRTYVDNPLTPCADIPMLVEVQSIYTTISSLLRELVLALFRMNINSFILKVTRSSAVANRLNCAVNASSEIAILAADILP